MNGILKEKLMDLLNKQIMVDAEVIEAAYTIGSEFVKQFRFNNAFDMVPV